MSSDSKRPPRVDARRNTARLLAAARELVARAGNDVALDEIARHAGVGNATLYRHFPTRVELLAAVYAEEVSDLCRLGADLLEAPSPLDALFTWLDEFVVHVATKRPLALAATAGPGGQRTPRFDAWHAALTSTATELVSRAALRPDVTAADVLALATGAALTAPVDQARHLVALLRTGLTAPPGDNPQ